MFGHEILVGRFTASTFLYFIVFFYLEVLGPSLFIACLPPSSSLSSPCACLGHQRKLWIAVDVFIHVFCAGKQNFPLEREDPFLQSKHPMTSVKLRKSNPSKFL